MGASIVQVTLTRDCGLCLERWFGRGRVTGVEDDPHIAGVEKC